jgi:hypothetical protein
MSKNQFRRHLRQFASTGVLACALIGTPVSIRIQVDSPIWQVVAPQLESGAHLPIPGQTLKPVTTDLGADAARRKALAQLGLAEDTAYAPPVLLTLSRAEAASGSGSGGDSGDSGDSGSDGGDSGDSSGSGGSGSGDGSGPSGGDDSDDNSGPGSASGPSSDPSGPTGVSGASGSVGASGGSFGDVEQVGPSLSEDEEAAAILSGWQ